MMVYDEKLVFPAGMEKCKAGRLIRAKELLKWFRTLDPEFKENHRGITDYYWFVYQERSDGQGHALIHYDKTGKFDYRGTGNYENTDWPVQWHYLY